MKLELLQHYECQHPSQMCFYCPEANCQDVFVSKEYLRQHIIRTHEAPVCCESCRKIFRNGDALEIHKKKMHPNKVCEVCYTTFKTDFALSTHRQLHKNDQHQCVLCGNEYISKQHLQRHMYQNHSGTYQVLVDTQEQSPNVVCN